MKGFIIFLLVSFLTGCGSLSTVTMLEIECDKMLGRIGNSCKITAPQSADIKIDGENIEIYYKGQ